MSAKHQGREFAPTVPTTRAGSVAVPAHANVADVRFSPCPGPQPLSDGVSFSRSQHLQAAVRRPSHRLIDLWGWGNVDWFAFVGQHRRFRQRKHSPDLASAALSCVFHGFCGDG